MSDAAAQGESLEQSRMTLGEHLEELRIRLIRSAIGLLIAFGVGWAFHTELAELVFEPYERSAAWLDEDLERIYGEKVASGEHTWDEFFTSADPATRELRLDKQIPELMRGDAASSGFFFYMRICFYFALFFGGPYLLWQLWQFVAAGLYPKEKAVVNRYFPLSTGLFLGGVVFGYLMMVPYALYFLARMSLTQIQYWETVDNYFSFLTSLTLALGAVFQLPVVMLVLAKVGLVEPKKYSKYRGHCIIGALVVAAMLTPPDPFTQMLMALPIVLLYELGHVLARLAVKRGGDSEPTPA